MIHNKAIALSLGIASTNLRCSKTQNVSKRISRIEAGHSASWIRLAVAMIWRCYGVMCAALIAARSQQPKGHPRRFTV